MTQDEARVVQAIDREALLVSLQRLLRISSHGGDEEAAQAAMADEMDSLGLDLDRWEVDGEELRGHPDYGAEIDRDTVTGLVGCLEGVADGPTLVLNGHVDVVPPGDPADWLHHPWSGHFDGERVYGRGSADMKGGLAAGLAALRAISDTGVKIRGRVLMQSVVGEEDGGVGTLATILRGHTGDGAVIMEPTRLAVVTTHAGALSFRIRIRGRGAHGALRMEGVSALDKLFPVLEALRRLEERRNADVSDTVLARLPLPFPISVGTVRGGTWASTVPDLLTCEGRYGIVPGETLDHARAEFEAAVMDVVAGDGWLSAHPPEVEWWGGVFRPASTPLESPIVRAVREAGRDVLGKPPVVAGLPCGTDLRLLVNTGGTPGVLFGPGHLSDAHAPNESVDFGEVESAAKVLALTVLRFCGT